LSSSSFACNPTSTSHQIFGPNFLLKPWTSL
jgi:hypothetical protein